MNSTKAIKQHPILFKPEMVRAILDGRKSQTRRTAGLKKINEAPNDWEYGGINCHDEHIFFNHDDNIDRLLIKCPYGVPGERLWVRENFWAFHDTDGGGEYPFHDFGPCLDLEKDFHPGILYCATDKEPDNSCGYRPFSKCPSIHMPRWASRITLENTGVRVGRLQDISEEDAIAEGAQQTHHEPGLPGVPIRNWSMTGDTNPNRCLMTARTAFANYINSINGAETWYQNPFVWIPSFKVIEVRN